MTFRRKVVWIAVLVLLAATFLATGGDDVRALLREDVDALVNPGLAPGAIAKGKSPHLHYDVLSIVPYPWRADSATQGWKKMFYLNPDEWLRQ